MFDFLDPNSTKSLRKRASKLPVCPYKLFLEMTADQLESKKITKAIAIEAINHVRTGDPTLILLAFNMLDLNQSQILIVRHLLEKM